MKLLLKSRNLLNSRKKLPVLIPEGQSRELCCCPLASLHNLVVAFPSAGIKGGREGAESVFRCILGGTQQTHPETLKTAGSALGLTFKAFYAALPGGVVVIGIDYVKTLCGGVSGALLLADKVLLIGVDVGIAVVDGGGVAVG